MDSEVEYQNVVDAIESALPSNVPSRVREKILDAAWEVMNDHWIIPEEDQ